MVIQLVVAGHVGLAADQHQHGPGCQPGVGAGVGKLAPLPHAQNGDPHLLAQVAVAHRFAHQGGLPNGGFGKEQLIKTADNVGLGAAAANATGQGLPQHLAQLQHVVAARQFQNIYRGGKVSGGDDGHRLGDFAHGVGHVGVKHVVGGGGDQAGAVGYQAAVGFRAVQIAAHYAVAHVVQAQRFVQVAHQQDVFVLVFAQLFDQVIGDGVEGGEDDVALGAGRQAGGGAFFILQAHPGGVEELNEGEGEEDEQEKDAAEEDDAGKDAPQVGLEGDVAEAQGGHDGEGPVEAGNPAVELPFVFHDVVEEDAVGGDDAGEEEEEAQEVEDADAAGAVAQEVVELAG